MMTRGEIPGERGRGLRAPLRASQLRRDPREARASCSRVPRGDSQSEPASAPAAERGGDRFEFRVFRRTLGPEAAILSAIAGAGPFESSVDRYVVAPRRLDAGLKLRGSGVELKTLVRICGPLEQWRPEGRASLPARGRDLVPLLAPLDLPVPGAEQRFRNAHEVAAWAEGRGIRLITLRKRRRRFFLDDVQAELGEIELCGTCLRTLAVESVDSAAVTALVARLGLSDAVNTSYPRLLAGGFAA